MRDVRRPGPSSPNKGRESEATEEAAEEEGDQRRCAIEEAKGVAPEPSDHSFPIERRPPALLASRGEADGSSHDDSNGKILLLLLLRLVAAVVLVRQRVC